MIRLMPRLETFLPPDSEVASLADYIAGQKHSLDIEYDILCELPDKDPNREMLKAVYRDDWDTVRNMIGPQVSAQIAYDACHGNDSLSPILNHKLLGFLIEYDPACLLRPPLPDEADGSMLHATLQGNPAPSVVKALLLAGVDPRQKNNAGEDFLEAIKKQYEKYRTTAKMTGIPLLDGEKPADYEKIITMVDRFISQQDTAQEQGWQDSLRHKRQPPAPSL
mgnify:CR=1 FL=1